MEENKVTIFVYDESFDPFDTWEILGSGPIRFIHGNEYTVSFEAETYFIIYGMFSGKDEWRSINMTMNGWACDIKYKETVELMSGGRGWITILH